MRVLHAYKVYLPEVDGGIPAAIALAAGAGRPDLSSRVLVARGHAGFGRNYTHQSVSCRAVASLGNVMGMPLAPAFPAALFAATRQADVVALHAPFPLGDIGIAGLSRHTGLVVHWHAEIVGRRLFARALEPLIRRTLARADRIIVSDNTIAEASALLQPHRDRWEVVPFGVDASSWSSLDSQQCARVARLRQEHPRLVVSLGRLVPYKGYDVLLRAFQRVKGHLVIVGAGPEQERLQRLAQDLGLSGRVDLTGYLPQEDAKVHLHAGRVFAFPSVTNAETFGISQLEAMAAGLAVVNTSLPTAVPQVARDGLEAVTVPPGDPVALASALNRLLDDEPLASRLGAAGKQRVHDEFDHARFVARTEAIYRDVYAARRNAG